RRSKNPRCEADRVDARFGLLSKRNLGKKINLSLGWSMGRFHPVLTPKHKKEGIMKAFRSPAAWGMAFFLVFQLAQAQSDTGHIARKKVAAAQELLGLDFTRAEQDSMRGVLKENLAAYDSLRKVSIPNSLAPVLVFDPIPTGFCYKTRPERMK